MSRIPFRMPLTMCHQRCHENRVEFKAKNAVNITCSTLRDKYEKRPAKKLSILGPFSLAQKCFCSIISRGQENLEKKKGLLFSSFQEKWRALILSPSHFLRVLFDLLQSVSYCGVSFSTPPGRRTVSPVA